jgi:hypothetical protein
MKTSLRAVAAGLATFLIVSGHALAQQSSTTGATKSDSTRPRDSTANLPSDTGSQTTLPSGAVTGAGQPQGKGKQADVGSPGGLEPRARQQMREEARGTGASGTSAGGAGHVESAPGAQRNSEQSDSRRR